jgi:NADH-quinone oxidoreductase subunit N
MSRAALVALLPFIALAASAVVVMLAIAFKRHHGFIVALTLFGLAIALAMLMPAAGVAPRQVTPLLIVDRYALFFTGLIFTASAAIALLSHSYFTHRTLLREEYYVLLLLAALGAAVLVASSHFAAFFLGLELLSVSLFALIAYQANAPRPLEAGIKYLILAGVSSGFLLFGMALIYMAFGTLAFAPLGELLRTQGAHPYVLVGLAMIIVGVGFKLSVVPFHLWVADVYEGASAPVSALLASVSKGAMFALLLRYFVDIGAHRYDAVTLALTAIAVASMLVGNLLALLQDNLKRLLAYSSVAHQGYVLVALIVSGSLGVEAVGYYLVAYFVTIIGAFAVVAAVSPQDPERDALEDYRGLFWRRPWLAGVFSLMLLSLAGIPLTIGFLGKFYVLAAGVDAGAWVLVITLVVGSAIGLFYYLRVVIALYAPPAPAPAVRVTPATGFVLAAMTGLVLWFGIYPAPLIALIQAAVRLG